MVPIKENSANTGYLYFDYHISKLLFKVCLVQVTYCKFVSLVSSFDYNPWDGPSWISFRICEGSGQTGCRGCLQVGLLLYCTFYLSANVTFIVNFQKYHIVRCVINMLCLCLSILKSYQNQSLLSCLPYR